MLGLGMSVANTSMAADDDVTIRMMDMNDNAIENVMKEIELPESASENGRENSAKGLANANERRALNRERKLERDATKEERKLERDAMKEERKDERDAMKDDRDDDMDTNITANMDNRPENPGDSRVTPEMPEMPELPEAADNRADQSNRKK